MQRPPPYPPPPNQQSAHVHRDVGRRVDDLGDARGHRALEEAAVGRTLVLSSQRARHRPRHELGRRWAVNVHLLAVPGVDLEGIHLQSHGRVHDKCLAGRESVEGLPVLAAVRGREVPRSRQTPSRALWPFNEVPADESETANDAARWWEAKNVMMCYVSKTLCRAHVFSGL